MSATIRRLLRSQANWQANRFDLALIRVIAFSLQLLALTPILLGHRGLPSAKGPLGLAALSMTGLVLVFFLAGWLSGDIIDRHRAAFLELIRLAGVRPGQWLRMILIQHWVNFLSVFVVRWPLLAAVSTLGGITLWEVVVIELWLYFLFGVWSSVALLIAFLSNSSRRQILSSIWVLPYFIETFLKSFWTMQAYIPDWFHSAAEWLASLSATSFLWSHGLKGVATNFPLRPALFYGGLWAVLMFAFWRLLVSEFHYGSSKLTESFATTVRDSRRCWDHALAWQACHVHGLGVKLLPVKWISHVAAIAVFWFMFSLGYREFACVWLCVDCAIWLLMAMNKPGDCLQRELKEQTLSTLLLAVGDERQFYPGWQRGALWLARPEFMMVVATTFCLLYVSLHGMSVALGLMLALLLSGPFLMLSPLVPYRLEGIASGLGIAFALGVVILTPAFLVPHYPLLFPPVVALTTWIFNAALRHWLLPYWMRKKINATN